MSVPENSEVSEKLRELTDNTEVADLLKRVYNPKDADCEEEDCDPLMCPSCGGGLNIVFGTLPLKVQCSECKRRVTLVSLFYGGSV